jgi:signal transduction histidine kinase
MGRGDIIPIVPGLALCNEIVKLHGGEMDIKSELDAGTVVVFTFSFRERE